MIWIKKGFVEFGRFEGFGWGDLRSCERQPLKLGDEEIFEEAAAENFVLVSADTDFGTLLASRSASKPSLILFRGQGSRRPEVLAGLMVSNLAQLTDALIAGCIVTFEPARLRIRPLPISS